LKRDATGAQPELLGVVGWLQILSIVRPMMQEPRQERILPQLLYLFTAVTGLVDAVSYIGLGHVFTANMTGNIVLLGFAASGCTRVVRVALADSSRCILSWCGDRG